MIFCSCCKNMCSPKTTLDNQLVFICGNCQHEEKIQDESQLIVSTIQIKQNGVKNFFQQEINSCTKLDPTLPHIRTIPCPNPHCETNKNVERDVVVIRYDNEELKYMFICTVCDTAWDSLQQTNIL